MTGPTWNDVRATFEALVDRPPHEQTRQLERLEETDAELAREVRRLLDDERASRSFLGDDQRESIFEPLTEPLTEPEPGQWFAGYRLARELGKGGMATVFEAEQREPRRAVALKVLRADLSAPDAARRFALEAEVLARLHHPHIAQVYEFGVDEATGRPYFALEYVPGARDLITYARDAGLGVEDRLALFAQVTSAVAFGHRKGIIHRDLKPANLLVDAEGQVKVIDFGIARVLPGSSLAEPGSDLARSSHTEAGQLLGTLVTMAPEQFGGDPAQVDTRADVYSLGCVLYELLEGVRPIDVSGESIARAIQRLQSESARPPDSVARELGWILMRALEKEPERRYAGVDDLARDLERYRSGAPVVAAPPSRIYLARKFVARNRALVGGTLAVVVALGLGLVRTDQQRRRAERAEGTEHGLRLAADAAHADAVEQELATRAALERVQRESARTRAIHDLLLGMFNNAGGPDATASELLHAGSARIALLFEGMPGLRSSVEVTLGKLFVRIEELEPGRELVEGAVARVRAELEPDDPERIRVELDSMLLLFRESRLDEAADLVLELEPRMERSAVFDARTRGNLVLRLGAIRGQQGRHEEAIEAYERGHELYIAAGLVDEPDTWRALGGLSISLCALGRPAEALEHATRLHDNLIRILGPDDQQLLLPLTQLALIHTLLGQPEEAIGYYERHLELLEATRGRGAPERLRLLADMTSCLANLGRDEEARRAAQDVLDSSAALPADARVWASARLCSLVARLELARLAANGGDSEAAETILEELIDEDAQLGPPENSNLTQAHVDLGRARAELGELDEALEALEAALALDRAGLRLDPVRRRDQLGLLLAVADEADRLAEYLTVAREFQELASGTQDEERARAFLIEASADR